MWSRLLFRTLMVLTLLPLLLYGGDQKISLHPAIRLLDRNGVPVIKSGQPVSTKQTCGQCHDYQYITTHSYHVQQGLNEFFTDANRPDYFPKYVLSPGMFGKWCGMPNRVLAAHGTQNLSDFDLGRPEWVQKCGTCHVGGGPSELRRNGQSLDVVNPDTVDAFDPDFHYVHNNQLKQWDWRKSGVMEMDCFLCHVANFDRESRDAMLKKGQFKWAVTATLAKTGLVQPTANGWKYQPSKFDAQGYLKPGVLRIDQPQTENCAQCHGFGTSGHAPINPIYAHNVLRGTLKMGRVFSPDFISESHLNIKNKEDFNFAWDVHAERLVSCNNCHFSLNHPAYKKPSCETNVDHLKFEPRLPDADLYLNKPSHEFAKGDACPETVADHLDNTMRTCEDCHDATKAHDWLPYPQHHFKKLGCETCHIPDKKMWAFETVDWTVLKTNGKYVETVRGIQGAITDSTALITGFVPAILPRVTKDRFAPYKLMPYNLITSIFWYDEAKQRPVFTRYLQNIYLMHQSDGQVTYRPEIVRLFDRNGDGILSQDELQLDSSDKIAFIKTKLQEQGIKQPVIRGEIVPFSINHNVVEKQQAIKDCMVCHGSNSRLFQPVEIARFLPQGTQLHYAEFCAQCVEQEDLTFHKANGVFFNPKPLMRCFYIIGHDRVDWVETIGILSVFLSLIGIVAHDIVRVVRRSRS